MALPKSFVEFPWCEEGESYAQLHGGAVNDVWRGKHPESERILTPEEGEQNIIGYRGHWAIKQLFDMWHIPYEEDRLYPDRGDKFDFNIDGFGTIDAKTRTLSSTYLKYPDVVSVDEHQIGKIVDYYMFCCWHPVRKVLWVIGWIERDKFIHMAKPEGKGARMWNKRSKAARRKLSAFPLYPVSKLRSILSSKLSSSDCCQLELL